MTIKKLSEAIINRMAAGEIARDPSYIVKELTDNSIDAKSKNISIYLEQAGKNLIIVADDGEGMARADLDIATDLHTTSKLQDDDLLNIHTLGFRGEALAAIAHVSKLKITSYDQTAKQAYQLTLIGGAEKKIESVNAGIGTKIEVRDLFFATPTRLKFLRSERTELNSILAVIKALALAYHHVSFQVTHNKKQILNIESHTGENTLYHRIHDILGKEYAENCIPISLDYEDIKIFGVVSLPKFSKPSSEDQYLFVNGRPVRDKLLHVAIKIAYQDSLPRDRYPVVVLFLELNCHEVDVNVHPNKNEVRFQRINLIRRLLINAISTGLHGYNYQNYVEAETHNTQDPQVWQNSIDPHHLHERGQYQYKPLNLGKSNQIKMDEFRYQAKHYSLPFPDSEHELPADLSVNNFLGQPLAVFQQKYLLTKNIDDLFITDLYAAKEYLTYRQLEEEIQHDTISQRALIFPEIISLEVEQVRLLLAHQAPLQQLGFFFEAYGEDSIIVAKIPAMLADTLLTQAITDLAESLVSQKIAVDARNLIDFLMPYYLRELQLDPQSLQQLINTLTQISNAELLNYHRPIYLKLREQDLQQLFRRESFFDAPAEEKD